MILVAGGIASGKKTYLQTCGIDTAGAFDACNFTGDIACLENVQVLLHAEELVRNAALDSAVIERLLNMNAITYNEVGSGVIPLSREDRLFRERAGSLSSLLAKEAACVVRMVCGIPVVLKGEAPDTGETPGTGEVPDLLQSPASNSSNLS